MTFSLRSRIESELTGNLLPYWINHTVDYENDGFYGAIASDGTVRNDVERTAILCARILWTYSAAYRQLQKPEYIEMAGRAYRYLIDVFIDKEHGGVYWTVDAQGKVLNTRKQMYAQAFAIYGLAEYHAASGMAQSLEHARHLFALIEKHGAEPRFGGYIEARAGDWGELEDQRLSPKEPNCPKSMNTLLHIMEAYTRLYTLWPDAGLKRSLTDLLNLMLTKVYNAERRAFNLFFDLDWASQSHEVSYGHDIEGAWLMVAAAEALEDETLLEQSRKAAVAMSDAVYTHGRDVDGSIFYEAGPAGLLDGDKHWWAQAEALIGFYVGYELSGDERFFSAAGQVWEYIETKFVDRKYGEWYKILNQAGEPRLDQPKTGPWECPYHNGRACLEMLRRLPPS